MTVAISAHYVITAMTVAAVTFNLQTHSVFMAFLSVAAAVIYPILGWYTQQTKIYSLCEIEPRSVKTGHNAWV
ncbi:hypothetical protein DPMN_152381 [Dreissena polymorpha]|uniref:Uncharacterized protein n=1 Tax=Dreissena polymorpha TaxID=45954 RepID=A0A9D4FKB0_DREPO|nr:hypothetical protein DPMN_152381 [Dreissena polymorpha]